MFRYIYGRLFGWMLPALNTSDLMKRVGPWYAFHASVPCFILLWSAATVACVVVLFFYPLLYFFVAFE